MSNPRGLSATVLMSGGVDSTACGRFLQRRGASVRGVFIDHGQAAAEREAKALGALAAHLSIEIDTFRLSGAHALGAGELVGRNAMLIFSALFLTRARPGLLAIGIHAGTPYFDCSGAFVDAAARLVSEHTDGKVSLVAPFVNWSKKDVFDYFVSERLPVELTYSCEAGTDPTCGNCSSCRDRRALT
jgi:7-cyano-7-deazaguanine synthase